jgi:hypothetical protein
MAAVHTLDYYLKNCKSIWDGTGVTAHSIRLAVLSGEIPCRKIGRVRYVEKSAIERYFCGADVDLLADT